MNADQTIANAGVVLDGELLKRFKQAAEGGAALTDDELQQLSRVTNIGDFFLADCRGLIALDLSPFRNVTSIGRFFLLSCSGLTQIDLSPLSKITSCRQGFLCRCNGLTALDLTPLRNVTSIGDDFLHNCTGLTQLASSPLARKLGWDGGDRFVLARMIILFNKRRIMAAVVSWRARKTALLIRNFAPRGHASNAFKIWTVMRCVVRFLSPLRVPDAVLIAEEKRMLEVHSGAEARSA